MPEPLTGYRVVDMTTAIQGSAAGLYLSDMGAEVIKIERPTGEATRFLRGANNSNPPEAHGTQFVAVNRGKKMLRVDAGGELGRAALYRLIERSDVFLTSYRESAMERLGFGYEALRALNPKLIYAAVNGFGPRGPLADKAMVDGAAQARGGLANLTGDPNGPPTAAGGIIADTAGGMQLALGVLTALIARERHGVGQKVNTSAYGTQLWLQMWEIAHAAATGQSLRRYGSYHGAIPGMYGIYETADGDYLVLPHCRHQFQPHELYWRRLAGRGPGARGALPDQVQRTGRDRSRARAARAFPGCPEPGNRARKARRDDYPRGPLRRLAGCSRSIWCTERGCARDGGRGFRLTTIMRAIVVGLFWVILVVAGGKSLAGDGVPRTAWGAPDLQGVWDFHTTTPLEAPGEPTGEEALRDRSAHPDWRTFPGEESTGPYNFEVWLDGPRQGARPYLVVDPPDGRIPPLTPDARVQVSDALESFVPSERPVRFRAGGGIGTDGPEDRSLAARCILGFNSGPPMLPFAYNNTMQLFQNQEHVVIVNEMVHDARVIPLDGRPHLPKNLRQWMGDSRGHWEGDTLIVETTNFTDKTASFNPPLAALGTGETLHLTERFTRIDSDTLRYEFTIDDPVTFTRPFTVQLFMRPSEGGIFEFACHEGNYGLMNILKGARAEERSRVQPDATQAR